MVGYNVYRISQPNGQRVKLTRSPYTETKYVDATVEGGHSYIYYVTAVDSNGSESRASDPTVAIVPTPDACCICSARSSNLKCPPEGAALVACSHADSAGTGHTCTCALWPEPAPAQYND